MVHGIVTAQGGQIRVWSRPGEGTIVRVLLPRLESAPPAPPTTVKPTAPRGSGRILVAEDEDDLRDVLSRHLRALRPDLPVIVCSGYSELLDEATSAQRGFDRFLLKPVGRADLAAALQSALGQG